MWDGEVVPVGNVLADSVITLMREKLIRAKEEEGEKSSDARSCQRKS